MFAVAVLSVVAVSLVLLASAAITPNYNHEQDATYWHNVAQEELDTKVNEQNLLGVAKNIIIFLGDGMGPTTVTAGRILAGQLRGKQGEEHKLSFDRFPHTGLSRTYNVDHQITDSAASATAYLCGVKTNQGALGVTAQALRGDCESSKSAHVHSILDWAHKAGKSTGIVTTTRITHATPAAAYANIPDRDWEADSDIAEGQEECTDIAKQLIMENDFINVIMGGGRAKFYPKTLDDPKFCTETYENTTCMHRADNINLVQKWEEQKKEQGALHKYVFDKQGLDEMREEETDYLLGLFAQDHMDYEVERNDTEQPSLREMTERAIQILKKNENGFFLLVEGGRIDHGHHASQAMKALRDVVAFDDAIDMATKLTDKADTQIVVTADHSHVMSIAGYAKRGNPILGISNEIQHEKWERVTDNLPYTTILYANGPGYLVPRPNITDLDVAHDKDYISQSGVPMNSETHGGEDVAIYASGPQSFLYSGVHEQNYIPLAMAYAACIGPYGPEGKPCAKDFVSKVPLCATPNNENDRPSYNSGGNALQIRYMIITLLLSLLTYCSASK